jgi:hypothetical protein
VTRVYTNANAKSFAPKYGETVDLAFRFSIRFQPAEARESEGGFRVNGARIARTATADCLCRSSPILQSEIVSNSEQS